MSDKVKHTTCPEPRDDGGPMYPTSVAMRDGTTLIYTGISLRDYLACQAVQGIIGGTLQAGSNIAYADAAVAGYAIADAMLRARKQVTP